MEEGGRSFRILTGIPTGNRSLEWSSRKLEDNIRVDSKINMSVRGFVS